MWWPSDPDELLAVIWLLAVLGSVSIVGALRFVLWVTGWPIWDRLRRPSPAPAAPVDYVAPSDPAPEHDAAFTACSGPERPSFVQDVQALNTAELSSIDIIRLDTVARLMAAGAVTETAAITSVWDGRDGVPLVKRGGSKAYLDRRDALRALATRYGWKAPEPAPEQRQVAINGGRDGYVSL